MIRIILMRDKTMLKFYSRETKPSLKPLYILTAVVLAMVVGLSLTGFSNHSGAICMVLALYFLSVAFILRWRFMEQIKYAPYSYNTIFYAGFGLFALAISLMYIILTFSMLRESEYQTAYSVLSTIAGSAKTFMLLSAPFILIFSIAMIVSNISLIRHEGGSFVNFLGIILSALFLGGWTFLFAVDMYVTGSMIEVMVHDVWTGFFASICLYVECMVLGTIIADFIAARHEPDKDKDYMLILGCAIRKDGTPTPLLRGRIDRAIEFYEAQKTETGKELTFITSGGQGSDEVISESACMKRYLMEQGIPEERIIEENKSTNTLENMLFSKEKIDERGGEPKVAFSTTNYHVFRSGFFARSAGMKAEGIGAPTKWYFWPNAAVREFVGLLTKRKGLQLTILGIMAVCFAVLTVLTYTLPI